MNRFIIASAGSGKTEYIVKYALGLKNGVVIATYTERNENEIRERFYKINGSVPSNVKITTWFKFLLSEFVRPYQDIFYQKDIEGVILASGCSVPYTKRQSVDHYFSKESYIYSDKIAELAILLNDKEEGRPFATLSRIYPNILIDEVQDFAGYDLEILIRMAKNMSFNMLCVGDPRQCVYYTSNSRKNYYSKGANLLEFLRKISEIEIDEVTLCNNHRCVPEICELSDKLYPEYQRVKSSQIYNGEHKGIFYVKEDEVDQYIYKYKPIILRWSKSTKVAGDAPVYNFGDVKGANFDRVLLYPTQKMLDWLIGIPVELSAETRSKLYVGLTRAKYSVAIVTNSAK